MRSCTRLVGDHPPVVGLVPVSCRVHPNPNDLWKDFPVIMRALEPEVMDVIWQAVEPLLPATSRSHPLGCHRPRVPDRLCFRGIMIRLVRRRGSMSRQSLTTRCPTPPCALDVMNGSMQACSSNSRPRQLPRSTGSSASTSTMSPLDGSLHKAPYGGEGTGANPTDRAKLGWKWSVASERHGIPVGWAIDGANRNDVAMLEPTLDAIDATGLLDDIGTLHLDRGYDSGAVRDRLRARA